jgi:hypothetical protein
MPDLPSGTVTFLFTDFTAGRFDWCDDAPSRLQDRGAALDSRRIFMRRFKVFLSISVVVLVGIMALDEAPVTSAQDPTPAAESMTSTDIRYLLPFTPDGLSPGLTAVTEEEGICGFASSAALDRPDAWDCLGADDQIYDPCFENPFIAPDELGQVACFDSPFSTEVVVLTLTEPLVREKEAPDPAMSLAQAAGVSIDPWDLPWALELANGEQCTLLGGTLSVQAGQTVHYGCLEQGTILGEVQHQDAVWTVNYLAEGEVASSLVPVTVAWS